MEPEARLRASATRYGETRETRGPVLSRITRYALHPGYVSPQNQWRHLNQASGISTLNATIASPNG